MSVRAEEPKSPVIRLAITRRPGHIPPRLAAPYADSLVAYVMDSKGEAAKAREIVARWKGRTEELDLLTHWAKEFPEVAKAWQRNQ